MIDIFDGKTRKEALVNQVNKEQDIDPEFDPGQETDQAFGISKEVDA